MVLGTAVALLRYTAGGSSIGTYSRDRKRKYLVGSGLVDLPIIEMNSE